MPLSFHLTATQNVINSIFAFCKNIYKWSYKIVGKPFSEPPTIEIGQLIFG